MFASREFLRGRGGRRSGGGGGGASLRKTSSTPALFFVSTYGTPLQSGFLALASASPREDEGFPRLLSLIFSTCTANAQINAVN